VKRALWDLLGNLTFDVSYLVLETVVFAGLRTLQYTAVVQYALGYNKP